MAEDHSSLDRCTNEVWGSSQIGLAINNSQACKVIFMGKKAQNLHDSH